jgi:FeS assembly SUF system regulator
MIKISRLSDYSLVLLRLLAAEPDKSQSAAVLAKSSGISFPTVCKILKILNEAGILISTRGANGGYKLLQEPAELNLAKVLAAMEGAPALTECCEVANTCIHDSQCALRQHWQMINRIINHVLSQFSLADLQKPLGNQEIIQRLQLTGTWNE